MNKNKFQTIAILSVIGFSAIILSVTVFMTLKNTGDLRKILEESIKSQLISTSIAARGIIDIDAFDSYNSEEDVQNDKEAHLETLERLRTLKNHVGASYIYALKMVDGIYRFIFDTDEETDTLFEEYELFEVHERAFLGEESAGVMNVKDEYGNFNTGAVPIFKGQRIIGIICTDIADTYIQESQNAATDNAAALIATLSVTMLVMIVIVSLMLKNIRMMQDKLFKMANYDVLTKLPNRQYLMNYLPEVAEKAIKMHAPFALFLIDLDNFKRVNDNAGHDAGDELLNQIAKYLEHIHDHEHSKSFRPTAGILNISARIGGDEFVQIVPDINTIEEAEEAAQNVLDHFHSQMIDRFIEKYQVGLSIGVALFPHHTKNYNVLIKYADLAMYHAKKYGKSSFRIYEETMSQLGPEDQNDPSDRRTRRR